MNRLPVDINCDMAESFGNYQSGNDAGLFKFISSANIACGYHAGDAKHIYNTVKGAIENNIRLGAHPSFPDLQGFGRRYMKIDESELRCMIIYQLSAVRGIIKTLGGQMSYVKPHGALYHAVSRHDREAKILLSAISDFDSDLAIVGLPDSTISHWCARQGRRFIKEGFADRRYDADGNLLSRTLKNAVIHDPVEAANQVKVMVIDNAVETYDGQTVQLKIDSICIHSDHKNSLHILKEIHRTFRNINEWK